MRALAAALVVAAAVSATPSGQAANFFVSPELAAEYGCGESCQRDLNTSTAVDQATFDIPFDFDFYETAANFSGSKPGDLLKLAPIDPKILKVPAGVSVYRIQYTSVDLDNTTTVPATGFIAFPFARQGHPFRLVAYAHGTTGVFRGCAPSASSSLFDYNSWSPLLLTGYAVVATDYAGLGNNYTTHKYAAFRANANDVYWSTVAAKKAFPGDLSKQWVSIGHSQGGAASWKLSEHELVQGPGSGYLGGVGLAPGTYVYDVFVDILARTKGLSPEELRKISIVGYAVSAYFGLRSVFGNNTAPVFSNILMDRIKLGEKAQLCSQALMGLESGLGSSDIFGDVNDEAIAQSKEFQDLNAPALGVKTSKPLLVVLGTNDTAAYPKIIEKAYSNSCKAGNAVHLSIYPGLDHSALVPASAPEWLHFIDKLFDGKRLHGCSVSTVVPFDLEHARKPLEVG